LIESANRYLTIRNAAEFGLRAGETSVHGDEIIARKKKLVDEFAAHRRGQLEHGEFDFIRGMAAFADANTIEIADGSNPPIRIAGRSFLISTGSKEHRVTIPGLAEVGCLDSDAILDCQNIPDSVIVLGGGAIAMEFAHYYEGLGTHVTILQRSAHVLKEMDTDVSQALESAFMKRGMQLCLNAALLRVDRNAGRKRVWFQHDGAEKSAEAGEIICALGRVPCVDGVHPERAGIALEHGKLVCNARQQTNVPHIFAAGDVAGPHEIVHIAIEQGELSARNAARLVRGNSEPLEEMDYRLKLFAVFSEPQIASAGFTEKELQKLRVPHSVARHPFDDHGKSMVMGETEGFVKLIAAEKTREILGAAVVGPHASDLIHEIVVAMYFRATARDLSRVPHYHPTLSEIWTYPAFELAAGENYSPL